MKFIDFANFIIKAGDGGNGIVSFRRELYVPNGGPNGGDGGDGGNIIFIVDEGKSSLLDLKLKKKYIAENGQNGMSKNMHGRNGRDLIISVPPGTTLYDEQSNKLIVDLIEKNQRVIVARGGKGGRGNARFANSRNKAPTIFENGDPGQLINIRAELKVLADIGFVGLPNAGKSTLLHSISNSKPIIADYPFTTINPQLGVCYDNKNRSFVVADLPGLIKGASQGKGLGIEFLKHVERCKIICHVIDITANYFTEDFIENYKLIRQELESYNFDLTKRIEIIVANKIDIQGAEQNFLKFKKQYPNKKIIPVSGLKKQNIATLLTEFGDQLESSNKQATHLNQKQEFKLYKFKEQKPKIIIEKIKQNYWQISGEDILRIYLKTPISTRDNLLLFNEKLKKIGVYDQLYQQGAKPGDIVKICDLEMEWLD